MTKLQIPKGIIEYKDIWNIVRYHYVVLITFIIILRRLVLQLEEGKIEIPDPDLKRQLSLSTEDLRFAENVVRQVRTSIFLYRFEGMDYIWVRSPP